MKAIWIRQTARAVLLCSCFQWIPTFAHAGMPNITTPGPVAPSPFASPTPAVIGVPSEVPMGSETFKTTYPKPIRQAQVTDAFRCERRFLYKGKVFDCDSNVHRDAERLRPILDDTPAAVAELDSYQRSRQNVRMAAYVGSMGLLIAISSFLVARYVLTNPDGSISSTGVQLQDFGGYGGLAITGLSVGYGIIALHGSEVHIDRAMEYHNAAHPDAPIELQFSKEF